MILFACLAYPWSEILPMPANVTKNIKNTNLLDFLDLANYGSERVMGDLRLIADYIL